LQRRLSHAKAENTLDYYAHILPGQDEVAALTIEALLADPDGETR